MLIRLIIFVLFFIPNLLFAYGSILFDDFFLDKTMRVDYYHIGNATDEMITIDQIYEQGTWAGNPKRLLDPFNNGKYCVKVYDVASNQLIFSKGFNSYFGEYQTTDPAIAGKQRTFRETALIPCPKYPIYFMIEKRDKTNMLSPLFSETIDPAAISILREQSASEVKVYEAIHHGTVHKNVDLAWIAEGYTADQYDKFKADVDRYVDVLFNVEPFKKHRKKFNVYGVFRASDQSGVDEPRRGEFRNTALNASFNALNLERYLLTEDTKSLHDIASAVPYDAIIIMVNMDRYGGGGIYNFYAITTVHNIYSENVFVHEFGHSFGGLADEYFSSSTSYNDFYPRGVEPTEPNITAMLNPAHVKWQALLSPGIDIPTDWSKSQYEALEDQRVALRREKQEKVADLTRGGAPDAEIDAVEKDYDKKYNDIVAQIKAFKQRQENLETKVGAFEGAGYSAKGLYRPQLDCMMFSNSDKKFCKVCENALEKMILFYAD
ncbi:peptidase M64 [candidate division KSB1 bacterium]|nr:peptidase M64 [candidate division KSB1 bacterium]